MGFMAEEIKDLENIYEALGNSDALIQNAEEIKKLNKEEMRMVASRLMEQCPPDDLHAFRSAIESTKQHYKEKEGFYSFLVKAHYVRGFINGLSDEKNPNPHNLLKSNAVDWDAITEFRELFESLVAGKIFTIATRLALKAPDSQTLNEIAARFNGIFPRSTISNCINEAFEVMRDMNNLLLGDKPETFFTGRGFSPQLLVRYETFFQYPAIVDKLTVVNAKLVGKESLVAAQFAAKTKELEREVIEQFIQRNFHNLVLDKKIHSAFKLKASIDKLLLGNQPELFFTDSSFSVDGCLEFSPLFPALIKGNKAQEIGTLLAKQPPNIRSKIARELEQISPKAITSSANPLRIIATTMDAAAPVPPASTPAASASTTTFFAAPTPKANAKAVHNNDNDNDNHFSDNESDSDTIEKSVDSAPSSRWCGFCN